jgi:hypothetical protein
LFEVAIGPLDFRGLNTLNTIEDSNGSFPVKVGMIESLNIGGIEISHPLIALSALAPTSITLLGESGQIGMYLFRRSVILIDYSRQELRVSSNPN